MGLTLLAIDSAGAACSAAIWSDGQVRAIRRLATERGHAAHLAPLVAGAFADARLDADDLDMVVASVGPGSFTGLRVGLALAQGVALAAGVPAWGVSSFRVHAAGMATPLVVALDSRREELFVAVLGLRDGAGPFMATPAEAAMRLADMALPAVIPLAGDAAPSLAAALVALGREARVLHAGPADAAMVASTAAAALAGGERLLPPRPVYLRPPDVTLPGVAVPA